MNNFKLKEEYRIVLAIPILRFNAYKYRKLEIKYIFFFIDAKKCICSLWI